jgi:DNA-binding NarL/FixJ family response regulator
VVVVIGYFDPLVFRGLVTLLLEDCAMNVLAGDWEGAAFAHAPAGEELRVAIMNEKAAHTASAWSTEPARRIVVVAHNPSLTYGMLLVAAGVTCLAVGSSEEDILAAVHLTARGGCAFVSGEAPHVERAHLGERRLLTTREIEVLERVSAGKGNSEIAYDLKISVATVNKHVERLLRKLMAQSKRDLVGLPVHWLAKRQAAE